MSASVTDVFELSLMSPSVTDVFATFGRHLWCTTEQTDSNMESNCFMLRNELYIEAYLFLIF